MTEKEKIRAKVERLMNELIQEKKKGYGTDADDACILELQNVLTFIDSMQEELVSKPLVDIEIPFGIDSELIEETITIPESCHAVIEGNKVVIRKGEEPVSDNLERAAEEYAYNNWQSDDYHDGASEGLEFDPIGHTRKTFIADAEWQMQNFIIGENLEEVINNLSKRYPEVSFAKLSRIVVHVARWQKEQDAKLSEVKETLWKDAQGDNLPEIGREVIALIQDCKGMYKIVFAHRPNPDGWDGKSLSTGEVFHYEPKTYDKGGWNMPDVKYWLDIDLPKEVNEIDTDSIGKA